MQARNKKLYEMYFIVENHLPIILDTPSVTKILVLSKECIT